jgi:hypothetical protein
VSERARSKRVQWRMDSPLQPSPVRMFAVEGQTVRCVYGGGRRVWVCECASFQERANQSTNAFCAHTAVAILRCAHDGSIEIL